ncbi:hypothetical protein ACA910_003914 [Epithemia clementina (nom. ined.)]
MKFSVSFSALVVFLVAHLFVSSARLNSNEAEEVAIMSDEELAAMGHPMYHHNVAEDEEVDLDHHERMLQSGCAMQVVGVKTSEYNVDWKNGEFQNGICPVYTQNFKTKLGSWWWLWANAGQGSSWRVYGTMMIVYNPRESVAMGFANTQLYYPITGGFKKDNSCPKGYVDFWKQEGDKRYYRIYMCQACSV